MVFKPSRNPFSPNWLLRFVLTLSYISYVSLLGRSYFSCARQFRGQLLFIAVYQLLYFTSAKEVIFLYFYLRQGVVFTSAKEVIFCISTSAKELCFYLCQRGYAFVVSTSAKEVMFLDWSVLSEKAFMLNFLYINIIVITA